MTIAYLAATSFTSYGAAMNNLVTTLTTAGWTIQSSGDGLAAYSSSGSVFSSGAATGANGWGNSSAWARIQDPGTLREFTLQHDNAGGLQVKYSQLSKFTVGGSSTVVPTATDERTLRGSYATKFFGGPTTSGIQYGRASDTAPYAFWFASTSSGTATISVATPGVVTWTSHGLVAGATVTFSTTGTLPTPLAVGVPYFVTSTTLGTDTFTVSTTLGGTAVATTVAGSGTHTVSALRSGFMLDPVTSVAEDPDPVVLVIGSTSAWLANTNSHGRLPTQSIYNGISGTAAGGVVEGAFGTMSADRSLFLYVQPASYACQAFGDTALTISNANLALNPFNAKQEMLPFFYARMNLAFDTVSVNNTAQLGLKGWSSLARWTTLPRAACLDTLDSSAWIAVGAMWLPWDGLTTPLG